MKSSRARRAPRPPEPFTGRPCSRRVHTAPPSACETDRDAPSRVIVVGDECQESDTKMSPRRAPRWRAPRGVQAAAAPKVPRVPTSPGGPASAAGAARQAGPLWKRRSQGRSRPRLLTRLGRSSRDAPCVPSAPAPRLPAQCPVSTWARWTWRDLPGGHFAQVLGTLRRIRTGPRAESLALGDPRWRGPGPRLPLRLRTQVSGLESP